MSLLCVDYIPQQNCETFNLSDNKNDVKYRGDQHGGLQVNWKNRKKLTTVFKICLYGGRFDSSVGQHKIF